MNTIVIEIRQEDKDGMDLEVSARMRVCDLLSILRGGKEGSETPRQMQGIAVRCAYPDTVIQGNGSLESYGIRQGSVLYLDHARTPEASSWPPNGAAR